MRRDPVKEDTVISGGYVSSDKPSPFDIHLYRGWHIWSWTGWKSSQDNIRQVGQWLSYFELPSGKRLFLYSSVPGAVGLYIPGGYFDISVQPGQVDVNLDTPHDILDLNKSLGLQRMRDWIDEWWLNPQTAGIHFENL